MTAEEPGRYDIRDELGRGGTAAVYRAYDRTLERFVALKLLSGPIANDPEFLARFEREARVAARLDHPGIVAIHDVGVLPDGRPFIAMRLLDGQGLDRLLAAGPLPWAQTLNIVQQLATALDYTHQRDTVHRDIKPSNVIVNDHGRATLTDFGIARALDSARVTLTGLTVGTPRYMAPEQIRGDDITSASDVYSLGVMTYEMLAGRAPFEGEGTALMYRIVHEPPPRITTLNSALPPEIASVLDRALQKEAADRWPSAGAFAAALAEALQAAPANDQTVVLGTAATVAGAAAAATGASSAASAGAGSTGTGVEPSSGGGSGAGGVAMGGAGASSRPPMQLLVGGGAAAALLLLAFFLFRGGGDGSGAAATPPASSTAAAGASSTPTSTAEDSSSSSPTPTPSATKSPDPTSTPSAAATFVAVPATTTATVAPTVLATLVAPTATATAPPTVLATQIATQYYASISSITLQGSAYVVNFSVQGFTLTGSIANRHVHFFFNTVTTQQAGVPGSGPWIAYAGGAPFMGYGTAQAGAASQMCILVANPDHSVVQGTGNCVYLP